MASPKLIEFNKTTGSDPIKKIAREIAKVNIYEYPEDKNAQQNLLYEELLNTASDNELIDLATNHKNAVVRLYAYRAIAKKFKNIPTDLFNQFDSDITTVNTMRGTIAGTTTVNVIARSFLY